MPPPFTSAVHGLAPAANQVVAAAPSPVSVTATLSSGAAAPCAADALREWGATTSASGTGAVVTSSVSITVAGDPVAPVVVTVIVSTYVPGPSPVMLRDHVTDPLPVPLPLMKVVHACRFDALHAVVDELSPVSVMAALSPGAVPPGWALALRDVGLTVMTSGTGGGAGGGAGGGVTVSVGVLGEQPTHARTTNDASIGKR